MTMFQKIRTIKSAKIHAAIIVVVPIVTMLVFFHVVLKPCFNPYVAMCLSYVLLLAPAIAYYKTNGRRFLEIVGSDFKIGKIIKDYAITTVILLPAFYLVVIFLMKGSLKPAWPSSVCISAVAVSQWFIVAIMEELYFRGYAFDVFRLAFPWRTRFFGVPMNGAIIGSSISFVLIHNLGWSWPPWGYMTLFPGMVFGILREQTGNIIAPIMFHICCNAIVFFLNVM